MSNDVVLGIDLGTTNSEVAVYMGDQVQVVEHEGEKMLPSCVGLSLSGEMLIGQSARNQQLLYPERTIRSIKRKMGQEEKVSLGENKLSPPEISALLLQELSRRAEAALGHRASKAIITVPAYFNDAQRQATREAGALAGLEVVRILNEPTAAALAYGSGKEGRTELIYDLGGGTFDVSIVVTENDITEVLASHGDNHLGGDDFDALLFEHLALIFREEHDIDIRHGHPQAAARLWWAVEEAKKRLSIEPFYQIREEALVEKNGAPCNLNVEISREEYEEMIRPLVEKTLASVNQALQDANCKASDLDGIILVGGSTRTPLIAQQLEERTGLQPRQEIDPDLCVVLGAGLQAARISGHALDRILVDVSPWSFGIEHLEESYNYYNPHGFKPTIKRNTPLPVTRTETYYTSAPNQTIIDIRVFQGESNDTRRNILIGEFCADDLTPFPEQNEVLCRMQLDLDGILHVSIIQKRTGKASHITIEGASRQKSAEELAASRKRLSEISGSTIMDVAEHSENAEEGKSIAENDTAREARLLIERSRSLFNKMHSEDQEEAIDLHDAIEQAITESDNARIEKNAEQLRELLFFVEGK